jgi:DNA repair exonuclease SbcCD ATPase subunit
LDNSDTDNKNVLSNEQIDHLSSKINDLDLSSTELTEKLDELLNQKNLFSEKFNDELDIKLTEALNRSEENLEGKINNINDTYHQEFSKYEDETNKNFANLEDQIGQLNQQLDKISNFQDYNIKIENSLNNLNNKIEDTLEKISSYKNETSEKFAEINHKIEKMEPELVDKIIEKERNKSESEKLQDKFDQMSKIMDMQNMRMLQMYHSSELQHSHSLLQKNMESKNSKSEKKMSPEIFSDELKKEVFPKIQKEMDKQFALLKEQLSEYEIKSVLDKIGSTDLNKEFKKPIKKFANFYDAKKYVKSSITKKSRDWIKNNDIAIDEIAKKLLDK